MPVPPTPPTDAFWPRTVTGTAERGADGCIQLTHDGITWHLTGPLAEEALVHNEVEVMGLPGQGGRKDCGEPQLAVSAVAPIT